MMNLPERVAPFKQEAKKLHDADSSYFYGLFQEVIEKFQTGPPSFAKSWSEKDDHYNLKWKEAAWVIATLYVGGSGTTSFEWQRRLHEKLTRS
jgi:hypothetical protein